MISDGRYLDSVIKLSIIIIKLIDKHIWNKDPKILNPYLKVGYEGWISTIMYETSDNTRSLTSSAFRSRWEPKYILNGNAIYIEPPIHKVKAAYNYWDIRVIVVDNDEKIYTNNELDIREIIGGYQINVDKIRIHSPISNITYKLMAGNEVIYDSKEKLNRSFIIFDTSGNEIKNNTDYTGTAVFCYKNNHEYMNPFYSCTTYKLASQNVRLGDAYIIEDTIFNFTSLIKPGIFGQEFTNHFIMNSVTQEKLCVYKQIKFLVFESEYTSARYEIVVNGYIHNLEEYTYTISERLGVNKYIIDLDIDQPGIHSVIINQKYNGKRKIIASFNFALDPCLEVYEQKLDDENYLITVKTEFASTIINSEINVRKFKENWLEIEYCKKSYYYYISFDFDIYRISNSDWRPLSQSIWIGDISQNSTLDIYGSDINELRIYTSTGAVLEEVIKLKDRGIFKQVPIGFIMSYKTAYDYTMLVFTLDGVKKKVTFCYNKCILDEDKTELIFDPITKTLDVTAYFFGRGNVFIKICDSQGNLVYRSDTIQSGNTVKIANLESFEKYSIAFYEKEKGLNLKKEKMMKQYERVFYAWDDFVGKSFKISKVYFDQLIRKEFIRKSFYLKRCYVKFLIKEDEDLYLGEVYIKNNSSNFLLSAINPVTIKICSEVLDETVELSLTKDGDGLFLDFKHRNIMNTLDDYTATDIFSYIIEMNGVDYIE